MACQSREGSLVQRRGSCKFRSILIIIHRHQIELMPLRSCLRCGRSIFASTDLTIYFHRSNTNSSIVRMEPPMAQSPRPHQSAGRRRTREPSTQASAPSIALALHAASGPRAHSPSGPSPAPSGRFHAGRHHQKSKSTARPRDLPRAAAAKRTKRTATAKLNPSQATLASQLPMQAPSAFRQARLLRSRLFGLLQSPRRSCLLPLKCMEAWHTRSSCYALTIISRMRR